MLERLAGYLSPHRLRDAVLADGAVRRRVSVLAGAVTAVRPDGTVESTVDGRRGYDVVVLAAGAWTPALLRTAGLPAGGLRTKSIQYAVHPVDGWRPSQFVDEVTGLFGRPTSDGGLLLGLPTDLWQVDPDRPPTTPALLDSAARLASARFPRLRLGPAAVRVGAADCYGEPPFLALRPVPHPTHRVFTFSGGAGGSAKTALAASDRATAQLVDAAQAPEVTTVGPREGQ
jgi:glycine/D-amino acid oxidase-like deaminating enzyme